MFDYATFAVLETQRLHLRQMTAQDADGMLKLYGDPQVLQYYDIDEPFTTPEQALDLIGYFQQRFAAREGIRWAITLKETGAFIGDCGYNHWWQQHACGEIGYALAQAYWSRGIMTEAVGRIVRFGFEEMLLNRVQAEVDPANEGSIRVLDKLGFQQEGILRERYVEKNRYVDAMVFGLLRRDYEYDPLTEPTSPR
ncbi:MAG: GNAT family N-acetyltransferase [Anaerolineae bacterium]